MEHSQSPKRLPSPWDPAGSGEHSQCLERLHNPEDPVGPDIRMDLAAYRIQTKYPAQRSVKIRTRQTELEIANGEPGCVLVLRAKRTKSTNPIKFFSNV